jgi:putative ABC transport system permease protein
MPDWNALIRSRLGAQPADDDVVEELAEHAEEMYRSAVDSGRSPVESLADVEQELADLPLAIRQARAAKRRRLAMPGLAADPVRPPQLQRSWRPLWHLRLFAGDLSHGVRLLASRRGTSLVAVITLALGIGANTAIFSVVNSVLLAPLPFPESDRLVMLWEQDAANPQFMFILSKPNYEDLSASVKSFERTAVWEYQSFNIAGSGDPEQVSGMRISASVFPLLRVEPQVGRVFSAAEDTPGHDVVVISDGLWRRRFEARPDAVGRTIRLNGRPFEIVGVMPPAFQFTNSNQSVWVPIHFTSQDEGRASHSFHAAARLAPGVSFATAKAEVETLGRQMAARFPENEGESASIQAMSDFGVGPMRSTLLTMMGAVALVLLIACANVANLLLAQASVRQREFAIRAAIGASRGRLVSQVMGEGVALAIAGGLAGIGVAWGCATLLSSSLPGAIRFAPFRSPSVIPVSWEVLAFTLALATITGLLFSLAPAFGVIGAAPGTTLKLTSSRGATGPLSKLRGSLVAAEVALSLVVLAAAGLTVKSMMRLTAVNPGLVPSNVLVMEIALPQAELYGRPERPMFCQDVTREISGLPGVKSVGAVSHLPLSGANAGRGFTIEGRVPANREDGAGASYRLVCPGFFETLGVPIVRGRGFTHQDSSNAPRVVIINEMTAARYWPKEDPLGKRIKLGDLSSTAEWMTIVGVVGNVRHFGLDSELRREIYRPYSQAVWPVMTITVKTATDPLAVAAPVRAALRRIDPEQPVTHVRTMEQVIYNSVGSRRFPMLLFATFAVVALLLAIVGVYGVVSYLVSQRTKEIGIRVALGARRGSVIRLVVGRSLIPIGAGIAIGIGGAFASSQLLQTMLFDVKPNDPVVLFAICSLLLVAAVVASWVPARRAASVDPLTVLRHE